MSAVAKQPMSTAIEADQYLFQLYSSGMHSPLHEIRVLTMVFGPSVTEVKRAQTTEG